MQYPAVISLLFVGGIAAYAGQGMSIDGTRIQPYALTWRQCAIKDEKWINTGSLEEELVAIGEQVFRHRQIGSPGNGVVSRSDTFFDRASFAPLRIETTITRDGVTIAYAERVLDDAGYTGHTLRDGERKEVSGAISSQMLHGMAMGLPLAAMDVPDGPVSFLASMMSFDATYTVIATWVGTETISYDGTEIIAALVDVEWHHRESGDVYPPGPDASGGRYWIVTEPPDGFPYVPRYKTDTYAVEFVGGFCPPAHPMP